MTTPDVRRDRRAQCWLKVRNESPIRVPPAQSLTESATRAERAITVAISKQAGHAREPGPEHERLGPDLRGRGERLDEPEQQPRVALHRPRDVAQHDQRPRFADLAAPDPGQELATGPEVAPEHRPWRQPTAVRMQLVAPGPASLEVRDQRIDQSLCLSQLGRRHPVELAMAEDLALRVGVGRDHTPSIGASSSASSDPRRGSACRARRAAASPGPRRLRAAWRRAPPRPRGVSSSSDDDGRSESAQDWGAPAPPGIERGVVDRPIVTPADEHRGSGRADLLAIRDVDQGQRPGEIDGGAEIDRQARRPQRPPKPDRLAKEAAPIDLGAERRSDDGGIWACHCPQPRAATSASIRAVCSPRTWRMSSSYLSTTPSVSSTRAGVELARAERQQGGRPVERLGDPGDLGQVGLAKAMDEADDLARELFRRMGHARQHDLVFLLGRRIVDPVVEAAPLERVVHLARPVRGQDHARRGLRPDRADLGDRDLEVGQDLEEVGLELLVGAIDLVDQQDRAPRRRSSRAPGGAAAGSGSPRRRCRGRSPDRPRRAPRGGGSRASGVGSSTRRRRC